MIMGAMARGPVRWLTAAVLEVLLCELVGVRHYIARFESRGNTSTPYYYWYFQGAMVLILVIAGALKQERRPVFAFAAIGAGVGYIVSFIVFHAALAAEMGSVHKLIESWSKLPTATIVSLMLLAPLILLAPVIGGILFGLDGLIALRSKKRSQVVGAAVH